MKISKSDELTLQILDAKLDLLNARLLEAEKSIQDRQNAMSGVPYSEKSDSDDEQEEGGE